MKKVILVVVLGVLLLAACQNAKVPPAPVPGVETPVEVPIDSQILEAENVQQELGVDDEVDETFIQNLDW